MFDYFIVNALCLDGTGSTAFKANLGITRDKISYIGDEVYESQNLINADGLLLTPGFIDTHCHSEFTLIADPRAHGRIAQGVTTEINGNCGLSAAPILGDCIKQREPDFLEYLIPYRWNTFDEYFQILNDNGIAINLATLCGQGNIRASVMGYKEGKASDVEMAQMYMHIKDAVRLGAKGLSTGLIYPPGVFTTTDELISLCKYLVSIKPDALYVPHMRSETEHLIEAIEETIQIARQSGIRIHISHLKTGGRANWHKIDKVIEMIEDAKTSGIDITCDRYPYIASSTDLDTILPKWVLEGGIEAEIKRLKDSATRQKISKELQKEPDEDWQGIYVSSVYRQENRWMEGFSVVEISERLGKDIIDTVIDIIIEDDAKTNAIFFSMSENNLKRFLKLPYMTIGSDSAVRCFDGITYKGKPHPRGFGSFPRFIGRYVRDEGIITIDEAIRRITSLPAKIFGLDRRGELKVGYYADIVLFDYHNIIDKSDYNNPFVKPKGIEWVFVNGVPVYQKGDFTNLLPGRVI
ncbi:MAG: D-aminoacylase [Thermodesulfovibrionales bacterium]|nr:D-aminoacylase [Thermodesulfovibrionales bacterium]